MNSFIVISDTPVGYTINVGSHAHMGDNFINFMFFSQIKEFLEVNNIHINYYCLEKYHTNLIDFCPTSNIHIHGINIPIDDINPKFPNDAYLLWQGGRTARLIPRDNNYYAEDVLVFMFNLFLQDFNLGIQVHNWIYEDPRIKVWHNQLSDEYKNIDLLIINSTPLSRQYNYNKSVWNSEIIELSKRYKIATTEFVSSDILCLDKFKLKDITAVSINVNYIIGINTGALLPLFNTYTLENVKKIYVFGGVFKHEKVVNNPHNLLSCDLTL